METEATTRPLLAANTSEKLEIEISIKKKKEELIWDFIPRMAEASLVEKGASPW